MPDGILIGMPSDMTSIKIRRELHSRIARIAEEERLPIVGVVERAIANLEREVFFERMQRQLEQLRDSDPDEWNRYRSEGQEWETATISDDIED